jgi:hypothetical protein
MNPSSPIKDAKDAYVQGGADALHNAPVHEWHPPADDTDSANSTNSTGVYIREHPIPKDSILAEYRDFVREVSELPDGLIVAPVLALCGKLLTPNVSLDFGGSKPLTIFNYIATPAGLRKSTTFSPAEAIARLVLNADDQIAGNASDSALFDTFEKQPHRLQFEDEGNTILRTWETAAYGREAAARYLKLYDGRPWTQNFKGAAKANEDQKAERHIGNATLSLCIGSTFGVAKLSHLDAGSGLRRRFGFYVATRSVREILWPRSLNGADIAMLGDKFKRLADIEGIVGEHSLTPDAKRYWNELQRRNRKRCLDIPGYTEGDENLMASLNESPSRCLKLAVIFQCCRYASGSIDDALKITPDVLEMAEAHQDSCLDALSDVESMGRRSEIEDQCDVIIARLSGDVASTPGKSEITLDKTALTRTFAANPGRRGSLSPSRLYGEIMPHLIRTGRAILASRVGKHQSFTFLDLAPCPS